MRILVVALGGPGHTFPLVPLALALRDAGHSVTFAVGPESLDAVAASGLEVRPAGLAMRTAFAEASTRQDRRVVPDSEEEIAQVAGEAFGDVLPRALAADVADLVAELRPDLLVVEAGATGAHLAALDAGVPSVTHAFGRRPDGGSPMGRAIRARLAPLIEAHGVPPAGSTRMLGHAYLDICPPSLQTVEPGPGPGRALPLRPTPWNPPVPAFVRRPVRRRWIYLTLGTAMGDSGILRTAVEGLTGLDADVLLATGSVDAGELADLDDDHVHVAPFVPQAELLCSADPPALVVHHGGSGTTLAAAVAGVPQLVLPQGADQFGNADAVVARGVARALVGRDAVTAGSVVAAAGTLLEPDGPARTAAADLAHETARMPSPAEAAARVEQWGRP